MTSAWKSTKTRSASPASALEQPVDLLKRRPSGVQEHGAGEVDDPPAHAGLLDDRVAPARIALQIVGRADDAVGRVEELVDLAVPVDVVAGRDHVDAGVEHRRGGALGDAEAAGDVLAVGDDEVRGVALAQAGQRLDQRPPARLADDVADEQEPLPAHAGCIPETSRNRRGRVCNGDPII